jgi:hypothetical protein
LVFSLLFARQGINQRSCLSNFTASLLVPTVLVGPVLSNQQFFFLSVEKIIEAAKEKGFDDVVTALKENIRLVLDVDDPETVAAFIVTKFSSHSKAFNNLFLPQKYSNQSFTFAKTLLFHQGFCRLLNSPKDVRFFFFFQDPQWCVNK